MSEEMYDVMDEAGKNTGQVLPWRVVHDRELWHGTVHIWIINSKREILMQFRGPNKKLLPNCWDSSVAGHVSAGESPRSTAIREIAEEIGLKVNTSELEEVGSLTEQLNYVTGGVHKEHETVFIIRKDLNIRKLKIQKSEIAKVKWFTSYEIEDILSSPLRRKELSKHADKLFYYAISMARL